MHRFFGTNPNSSESEDEGGPEAQEQPQEEPALPQLQWEGQAEAMAEAARIRKALEAHRGWVTRILANAARTLEADPEDYGKPVIRDALAKHLRKLEDQHDKIEGLLVQYAAHPAVTDQEREAAEAAIEDLEVR